MAGPCPRLNSDRGTLIINKSQESYSQWIPLGINLLGAAPTPSRAPPNSQGLREGRGQHREMGVPWRPPCLGTPCTPQGGAADEGGRQRQEGDPPPGHSYTPQQVRQGTERPPQCHQCHSSALPSTTMGVLNSPGVPGPPCAPQLCRDLRKAAMASTGGPRCAQGATG